MDFHDFFRHAFGETADPKFAPFNYQRRLAQDPWPDLLDVPTGMGKTAAVTLAWLWKRGWRGGACTESVDESTPRRLVWCLPMRALVEQTAENICCWLKNLGILGNAGDGKVSVHVLMGGENDLKAWAEFPEEDMILIGTQDMLLSRVLMRGYGMSPYQWPVHFALLHNDCLWVFDEVQLMGAGLTTSTQLEAFRRHFPLARTSRSLWVSATLNRAWLDTVDFKPHLNSLNVLGISDKDRQQAGDRLNAVKSITKLPASLGSGVDSKKGSAETSEQPEEQEDQASEDKDKKKTTNREMLAAYLDKLSKAVLEAHDTSSQTLVIVNRVERAQQLFRLLREARPGKNDLLIHARFRAAERAKQAERLRNESSDRIVVATQAIEAGVDISSRVLVTELAPWSSLVQRFGRCNRYGEHNADSARILWLDIKADADALPYTHEELKIAREKLSGLDSASPQDLPPTDTARPLTAVLRRKDLLDLFNTDPDLSGFDVDVSDYIRDSGQPGVQVFWRDFDDPNQHKTQPRPDRTELCPISMSQAKDIQKRGAWYWDALNDAWIKLDRNSRPGMTLLLRAADGGYDEHIGFDADLKRPPVHVITPKQSLPENAFSDDWRAHQNKPVGLANHLGHVAARADELCEATGEIAHKETVVRAGRWHDLGKAHKVFDATMHACNKAPAGLLAKSPCNGRHSRKFFRHELASMLAWLAQHDGEPEADLIAYLIAAHHGKVRMSLRAMPTEEASKSVKRFARGVWEGDALPAMDFDGEHSVETTLKLALMEIGEGEQGSSWTERTLKLLDQHGPFRLAWLETLVRLADWRASAAEQAQNDGGPA